MRVVELFPIPKDAKRILGMNKTLAFDDIVLAKKYRDKQTNFVGYAVLKVTFILTKNL